MTAHQITDLVIRVRHGGYETLALSPREFREMGWYMTTRSRCAARYARMACCCLEDAALAFDLTPGPVWVAWQHLFPGEAWICRHGVGWKSCAICLGAWQARWGKTC